MVQSKGKNMFAFILFLNYFIVVKLHLSAFSPYPSTPPQPNPPALHTIIVILLLDVSDTLLKKKSYF